MRFLLDMGVSLQVSEWLRQKGHDVVHLHDEGLDRLPNGEIFLKAIQEDRIVVTFDLDFGEIVALSHGFKVPVIVLRLHNTRARNVIQRFEAVLPKLGLVQGEGSIIIIDETRYRFRKFPYTE